MMQSNQIGFKILFNSICGCASGFGFFLLAKCGKIPVKNFTPYDMVHIGNNMQFWIIKLKVNHLHLQQYYTDFRVPAEDIECDAVTSAVCSGRFLRTQIISSLEKKTGGKAMDCGMPHYRATSVAAFTSVTQVQRDCVFLVWQLVNLLVQIFWPISSFFGGVVIAFYWYNWVLKIPVKRNNHPPPNRRKYQ